MPGNYSLVETVTTGQTITAAERNTEHQNHITYQTPAGTDDYSATVTEMRLETDPYPAGVASQATSTAGELERLRYVVRQLSGKTYWYEDPDTSFATHVGGGDTHAVYALLAGRASPQAFAFGTAASAATGYLTSTAHATKGKYFLNAAGTITVDDLNVRFGIGVAAPTIALDVVGGSLFTLGSTVNLAADGAVLTAKRGGTTVFDIYADDAENKLSFRDSGGTARVAFQMSDGSMKTGSVPLARMQVDEQSGSSATAWTTTLTTLVTLSPMSVTAGDRVDISMYLQCDYAATTTEGAVQIIQSGGTATGEWMIAGGTASTSAYNAWINHDTGAAGSITSCPRLWLRITGSGTLTLSVKAQALTAAMTTSLIQVNALALRGT